MKVIKHSKMYRVLKREVGNKRHASRILEVSCAERAMCTMGA